MLSAAAQFRHFCTHPVGNAAEFQDTLDHHTFKKMLPRDERRFKAADLDGDQTATREEFTAFLHPEEFEHMKEIVVLVRSFKSLSWERTRAKSVQSLVPSCKESILQPDGYWKTCPDRKWRTRILVYPIDGSGQASCCNKQPQPRSWETKRIFASTKSSADGPSQVGLLGPSSSTLRYPGDLQLVLYHLVASRLSWQQPAGETEEKKGMKRRQQSALTVLAKK